MFLVGHDALQRQMIYERERGLMAAGAASGMLPGSLAASQHLQQQQQQQRHHEEYMRYIGSATAPLWYMGTDITCHES